MSFSRANDCSVIAITAEDENEWQRRYTEEAQKVISNQFTILPQNCQTTKVGQWTR